VTLNKSCIISLQKKHFNEDLKRYYLKENKPIGESTVKTKLSDKIFFLIKLTAEKILEDYLLFI
jgi:hypothetical protein